MRVKETKYEAECWKSLPVNNYSSISPVFLWDWRSTLERQMVIVFKDDKCHGTISETGANSDVQFKVV